MDIHCVISIRNRKQNDGSQGKWGKRKIYQYNHFLTGIEFQFYKMKCIWKWIVVMIAHVTNVFNITKLYSYKRLKGKSYK